jgi:transcriptional regulator with XRE-family HTH domain
MTDVARLAGVSHQTVSRVLNGHSNDTAQTRLRVHAAITELGYLGRQLDQWAPRHPAPAGRPPQCRSAAVSVRRRVDAGGGSPVTI